MISAIVLSLRRPTPRAGVLVNASAPVSPRQSAVDISTVSIPDCRRELVKRFHGLGGHETICPFDEAIFPGLEDRLKPTPANNAPCSDGDPKNPSSVATGTAYRNLGVGNEKASDRSCISDTRQRSAFGSDEVGAADAAFRRKQGGMEM